MPCSGRSWRRHCQDQANRPQTCLPGSMRPWPAWRPACRSQDTDTAGHRHRPGKGHSSQRRPPGRAPGHRQERGRSLADTYNLGGWFTAVGPARARCRTCARQGPVSRRGGPGHWRPLGRRRRLDSVAYRCKVVSRGRAAPPRHRVPLPVRGAPPLRAAGWSSTSSRPLAELIRDPSWRGSRCSTPRPGSTARQWRCWPGCAAHRTPRPADLGGKRRVRCAAEDRDLTQLRIPGFPAGTAAGPGAP